MNQSVNGFQSLSTAVSDYNSHYSVIKALLSGVHTATLVQVTAVANAGGVAPVGFVDVQPLVNQVTGIGVAIAQAMISGVPYFRLQGGANAVIIDPQVGDIGVAVFAERDISSVVTNKAQSNPGSARQHDGTDGMYFGSFLGAAPTQYIQFNDDGITILSPNNIVVQAQGNVSVQSQGNVSVTAGSSMTLTAPGGLAIAANTVISGNFSFSGSGLNGGVDIGKSHAHSVSGVQSGTSTVETSAPNE